MPHYDQISWLQGMIYSVMPRIILDVIAMELVGGGAGDIIGGRKWKGETKEEEEEGARGRRN